MTESEWLTCADPLRLLLCERQGKASPRKLRLFCCACCRRMGDRSSREAVEVAERFVDGRATLAQLTAVHEALADRPSTLPAQAVAAPHAFSGALALVTGHTWPAPEVEVQATLLRELRGNPIRPPLLRRGEQLGALCGTRVVGRSVLGVYDVEAPARWLAWEGGTVLRLAAGIYEERAFDQMPILADALEDAGCNGRAILEHCRQPGEHARGCWLLDLLISRE